MSQLPATVGVNDHLQALLGAIREGEKLLGWSYQGLDELEQKIQQKLHAMSFGDLSPQDQKFKDKLGGLLGWIQTKGKADLEAIGAGAKGRIKDIVKFGNDATIKAMQKVVPFTFTQVPQKWLDKRVDTLLVEGLPISEWFKAQSDTITKRLGDLVQKGVRDGKSVQDMVRLMMTDPDWQLMAKTKAQTTALIRTSVVSALNDTNVETFKENDDIVKGIQWVSTLDNRTTPICRTLDGKTWDLDMKPIGHGTPYPGPIAHWNCRSTQVPVLKTLDELGLGTGGFKDTTRASMVGQVDANFTASTFPPMQPPSVAPAPPKVPVLPALLPVIPVLPPPPVVPKVFTPPPVSPATPAKYMPLSEDTFQHRLEDAAGGEMYYARVKSDLYGVDLAYWNAKVKMHPEDIIRWFGPILDQGSPTSPANLKIIGSETKGEYTISATANGIRTTRTLNFETKTASNDYFRLMPNLQAKNIGKNFLRECIDFYRLAKMEKVKVHANIDIGGYAWARYGFVPTQRSWDSLRKQIVDPDLRDIVSNPNPKAMWALADHPKGKRVLLGTDWAGVLDLKDPESLARFYAYVGKGGK